MPWLGKGSSGGKWPIGDGGVGGSSGPSATLLLADNFSSDKRSTYSYPVGSINDWAVTGGALKPAASSGWRILEALTPFVGSRIVKVQLTPGSVVSAGYGIAPIILDSQNYIWVTIDPSSTQLTIGKTDNNVQSSLLTLPAGSGWNGATTRYLVAEILGNIVAARVYDIDPEQNTALEQTAGSFALVGADANKFGKTVGAGAGIAANVGDLNPTFKDLKIWVPARVPF